MVLAPCSVVSIRRVMRGRTGHGTRRQMSEATTPGCSAYVVIPRPAVRRASSWLNSTLASLDTEYSGIAVRCAVRRRTASKSMPVAE